MKRTSNSNNHIIRINEPCNENWYNMVPEPSGKFCNNCEKTVIDFTGKTNAEIIEYLHKNPFTCGRIESKKLNQVISMEAPFQPAKKNWLSIAAFLAAGVFSAVPVHSQIFVNKEDSIVQTANKSIQSNNAERIIYGTIIENNSKEAIPFANVLVIQNDVMITAASADIEGKFSITLPDDFKGKFMLKISSAGNPAKEFELNTRKIIFPGKIQIELDPGVTMGTFVSITQPAIQITPSGARYNRKSILNYPGQ